MRPYDDQRRRWFGGRGIDHNPSPGPANCRDTLAAKARSITHNRPDQRASNDRIQKEMQLPPPNIFNLSSR